MLGPRGARRPAPRPGLWLKGDLACLPTTAVMVSVESAGLQNRVRDGEAGLLAPETRDDRANSG
ncbi:hypothetical protein GCM10025783_18350 [Amnibacterium soli]|uniref:Uncharacterized protein n=1 Tax=Amnibacterium soli TaxID=1282736 RepID=A0ABP8Z5N2_9MICO